VEQPYEVRGVGTSGRQNKKSVTPVVGGWVRGQKRTRVRFIFLIFFMVFLNSPHRETPKNVIKKIDKKSVSDFWSIFLEKLFDTIFLSNVFCCVFELPLPRNVRRRTKKKTGKEKKVGWRVGGSGI
jgi:hypothetical protein